MIVANSLPASKPEDKPDEMLKLLDPALHMVFSLLLNFINIEKQKVNLILIKSALIFKLSPTYNEVIHRKVDFSVCYSFTHYH